MTYGKAGDILTHVLERKNKKMLKSSIRIKKLLTKRMLHGNIWKLSLMKVKTMIKKVLKKVVDKDLKI